MKTAALVDKQLEAELSKNGFVVIRNFIGEAKVNELAQLYKQHHPRSLEEKGMWNSLYDTNVETGLQISEKILTVLETPLTAIFESYCAPVATFMSKNCNANSTCTLHRDFSITDENKFQYRNIWIPLVPTSFSNGALFVLKGSNRVFDYVLPMFCAWPYESMQSQLFSLSQTVDCNAGDLVIYLDKTLHGSHVNQSQDSRPVVHFGVLHPECQLQFYYYNQQNYRLKVFSVPFRFFFEKNFGDPGNKYPLVDEFSYIPPVLEFEEVERILQEE